MKQWEEIFRQKIAETATTDDPAHDLLHFQRVVKVAKDICKKEKAKIEIVLPAAWFHDFINVPKDNPLRSKASKMSADAALEYLRNIGYPEEHFVGIAHAIEAHSYSANIECKTLEAMVVQDADRLDGFGAIGVARCFATSVLMKRPFYSLEDPFCDNREPNDMLFTIDHFYQKLFKIAKTLKTEAGREIGKTRIKAMERYLEDLREEISIS